MLLGVLYTVTLLNISPVPQIIELPSLPNNSIPVIIETKGETYTNLNIGLGTSQNTPNDIFITPQSIPNPNYPGFFNFGVAGQKDIPANENTFLQYSGQPSPTSGDYGPLIIDIIGYQDPSVNK